MRRKMVVGNWKMNLQPADAASLVREIAEEGENPALSQVELVVCPPALYLPLALKDWQPSGTLPVGAQNCHWEESGAYTGEWSANMLKAIGVAYCILGHSERRAQFGETNEVVGKKMKAAVDSGLRAILCCGETFAERENNTYFDVVKSQLKEGLSAVPETEMSNVIVAYEPVWAIGTGKTASSDQAQEMHAHIRQVLADIYSQKMADSTTILYGGSCKPSNANELFAQPDVDGGLIGGASLDAEQFLQIAASFS